MTSHRPILIPPLLLIALLAFCPVGDVSAWPPPKEEEERIFNQLLDDMSALETKHRQDRFIIPAYTAASKAAVQKAADDVRHEIERNGFSSMAKTSLDLYVLWGLSEIVEVLAGDPGFRARLARPFGDGEAHLWSYVALAASQAMRVCGDPHLDAGGSFFLGYYGSDPAQSPYKTVRSLLEQAGVTPRPAEAKQLWLRICNPQPPIPGHGQEGSVEYIPGARDRVANAPDILEAILTEIQSQVTPQGLPKPKY
jgi:hypothetical protein